MKNLSVYGPFATLKKIKGPLAYRKYKWPTRPSAKNPGNLIKSHDNILEFSLFGSSLLYLYDERIYEQLSIDEIINAYDLYTNIRQQDNTLSQITPDTAYWIVRELTSHCAALIFCPHCLFHYYSSLCQPIKMCCPFESQH